MSVTFSKSVDFLNVFLSGFFSCSRLHALARKVIVVDGEVAIKLAQSVGWIEMQR